MILFFIIGIWHNRFYPSSSMISTANRSAAHDLFVTGDTDGYLRLFRYKKIIFLIIINLKILKYISKILNGNLFITHPYSITNCLNIVNF